MNNMKKGKIIALAGVPSTGKTTVGKALAEKYGVSFLEEDWKKIIFFSEGKTPSNFEICIGFLNMRFEQIAQAEKLSSEGKDVFLDTFFEMTSIYSEQILPSDEFKEFRKVFDVYGRNLPELDKYIHFTGDLSVIRERALARKLGIKNEDQLVSLDNLKNTEKNILTILSDKDSKKVITIDVTKEDTRTESFLENFYRQMID